MLTLDPAWIALIGTVAGGVGLKVLEHWLGRNKVRVDEAARLREEQRLEITARGEEIKSLESEVDRWRNDYLDLRDKHGTFVTEKMIEMDNLRREIESLKKDLDSQD
jgi:phage host-nuclease inhibitor protein Gam